MLPTTTALPNGLYPAYEDSDFAFDDEDEELLNSVTEVANSMLLGYKGDSEGILGIERSQGLILRGFDMEWRNIL